MTGGEKHVPAPRMLGGMRDGHAGRPADTSRRNESLTPTIIRRYGIDPARASKALADLLLGEGVHHDA